MKRIKRTYVAKVLKHIVEIHRLIELVTCSLERLSDDEVLGDFRPEFVAFSSGVRMSFMDADFFFRLGEGVYLFSALAFSNGYFPFKF